MASGAHHGRPVCPLGVPHGQLYPTCVFLLASHSGPVGEPAAERAGERTDNQHDGPQSRIGGE